MTSGVDAFPLSFAQERLWFLEQLQPGTPLYNVSATLPLPGPRHVAALERSIGEIVRRHAILRATFASLDGRPVQIIAPALSVPLRVVDLSRLPPTEREAEARRLAAEEFLRPFDLAQGPLLRTTLLRLGQVEQLLLAMHHVVSDGWSLGVFFRELAALDQAYAAGQPSPLPELAIQYPEFAQWQREHLQGRVLRDLLAYWRRQLAGAPSVLDLPADHPRPPVQTFRGGRQTFALPASLGAALKALSQQEGVTLFMTLLASFKTLLLRYTGQEDLVVGSPIANRTRPELEGLIGFFVNTLVLRTNLTADPSFREVLRRVREVTLGAYAHQDLPFERLVEELQPERNLSHNPLFQTMFVLQNVPTLPPPPAARLHGTPVVAPQAPLDAGSGVAKFDLTLSMTETAHGLVGLLEYATDLFEAATIARMAQHFQTLLAGIVQNPDRPLSELPLLTEAERRQLLVEWNATSAEQPQERCIHELFEAQALWTPDAVAVTFGDEQLTYDRLNRQANQLAHHLRTLGVGPEVRVGLCAERSIELVVGLLGILKAGGVYVPLDPEYPPERLGFMLADAAVAVLLTQERLADRLPEHGAQLVFLDAGRAAWAGEHAEPPASGVTGRNLAYVIYTSGSTGRPKGVLLEHRGLCNVVEAQTRTWAVGPASRVLQFASLSFDASVSEIFMALTSGARLCLAPPAALLPGPPLLRVLRDEAITTATLPPSVLAALPVEPLPALSTLVVAGEACPAALVQRWGAGRRFFNAYGPTEATIWATGAECRASASPPPIGRPIPNLRAYVLDRHLQPVPVGVPGELHLAGVGLARGYLNQPDLTAEKFIPNPFEEAPGARLYKTGDLVRYRPDGNLEFLGRRDDQVKIRGYRVEPGEIEALLAQHPAVQEVAVVVRDDDPGDKRLVAYVVPTAGHALGAGELRRFLRAKLPEYLVPGTFVLLEALVRSPNGKLDRRALPAPDGAGAPPGPLPQTALERTIAAAWEETLQVERVGRDDNFFDLGGHSLLMVHLHQRLRESLNRDFPLVELFRYPTVSAFAAYLGQQGDTTRSLDHVHERALKQRQVIGRLQSARARRRSP